MNTRARSLSYALALTLISTNLCCAQTAGRDPLAAAYSPQPRHTERIYGVEFSPDGRLIATASWDGTVKLWDTESGRERRTLAGHGWGVYHAAFSPDGKLVATASRDWTAKVWDAATGRELRTLAGHTLAVKAVAWSPEGRRLATASNDGTVRLWDAATGRELRSLRHEVGAGADVYSVAWAPDGRTVAAGNGDGTVSLWGAESGREAQVLRGAAASLIWAVAFSPDGRTLASLGSMAPDVKLWEVATGRLLRSLEVRAAEGSQEAVLSIAWSPDGRTLAAGGASVDERQRRYHGWVKLWGAAEGGELRSAHAHVQGASAVAFSPDGSLLASASEDATLKLWRAPTLDAVKTLSASPQESRGDKFFSLEGPPPPEAVLQGTPAGERLNEWLGAFNTGNVYLMRGFARERFSMRALADRTADERALADLKLFGKTGALEFRRVESSSDDEVKAVAQSARTGETKTITLRVEEGAAGGVVSVEVK